MKNTNCAVYLIIISVNHIVKSFVCNLEKIEHKAKPVNDSSFWATVLKVELADLAFAGDSILAAVALAIALSATSLPKIGGLDGDQFLIIFSGGVIGFVIMQFAATFFTKLLHSRPRLETAAFLIGVKLAV